MLLLNGCSNKEKKEIELLKNELSSVRSELKKRTSELENIKNTPEQRNIRAANHISNEDLQEAKKEYEGIVKNFAGTEFAKQAALELQKIDKTISDKKAEDERKKSLGFKILTPSSSVSFGSLTIKFDKIWKGKRWTFDSHEYEYSYRDAIRGNSFILANVSISSTDHNPDLPPVLVYKLNDGKLRLLGQMKYEFRRWKNYGSYLGNHADYGNDFSHSKTIPFNLGVQESDTDLDKEIYVVIQKKGCFSRRRKEIGNPEIEYIDSSCHPKQVLNIEDFDSEYMLLKRM